MATALEKKKTTLMLLALLLFTSFSFAAARPSPGESFVSIENDVGKEEVSCNGLKEEECLMRRTLVAHTDYIYTQHTTP